jgi:hypothetical protein
VEISMNRKAWLKIAEAFFAVLLVGSVLIFIATRVPKGTTVIDVHDLQRNILKQISMDSSLRQEIIQNNTANTEAFIRDELPNYLDFSIKICEIGEVCSLDDATVIASDKEVYSEETLITSTLNQYAPKKLRFFVWAR